MPPRMPTTFTLTPYRRLAVGTGLIASVSLGIPGATASAHQAASPEVAQSHHSASALTVAPQTSPPASAPQNGTVPTSGASSTTSAALTTTTPRAQVAQRSHVRTAPTPTTTPTTTPAPSSGGYPSAATTGVPAGVALKPSGDLTVNTPGAVVDALDIRGTVKITASDVTLKRSRVTGSGFSVIRVADSARNVKIENVEVNGLGTSGTSGSMGIMGPATVVASNIWGVENGISPGSGSVLRGNYIHSLAAPGSPHIDGVQMDGDLSNIVIDGNTVDMREWGQTSTVMIDNYFGPINSITVNNNRLLGGGYTVYSYGKFSGGAVQGVSFTNNRLGRGQWGHAVVDGNQPVWSNNVDDSTGAQIPSP